MVLFSSNKTSTAVQNQTDNRKVLGEDSSNYELSNSRMAGGWLLEGDRNAYSFDDHSSTSNVTINSDLGAIKAASKIAKDSAVAAASVANNSISGALHFGSDALGFGSDAISANSRAINSALDFGINALGTADNAMSGALKSAGNSLDAGLSSMLEALGFGKTAMSNVSNAWSSSSASADSSRDNAFRLVDNVVGNYVDVINSRANAEETNLRSIYETALGNINTTNARLGDAYANSQGRGALTDKMLMVAIGGAVLIAVAAVWRK